MENYEISTATWTTMRALIDNMENANYETISREIILDSPAFMLDERYVSIRLKFKHFMRGEEVYFIDSYGYGEKEK